MSKLNGYDACRQMRAQPWGKSMVLVALTGWGEDEARQKSKDAGFDGHITLELSNVASLPITIYPGMKIGQLCFFQLSSPSETPYGSEKYLNRYQGQRGPTASRSFMNFHRTDVGNAPLEQ